MGTILLVLLALTGSGERAYGQATSDFDGDGSVGFGDFVLFAAAYGSGQTRFDLDGSGKVDFQDFVLFASSYGAGPHRPHWRNLTVAASPPGRLDHTMVLDARRRQLVVFGGKRDAVLNDTWLLDLATMAWREVDASVRPTGRRGHTAVADSERDRVIVFGGETDTGFLNDVWAFDLEQEAWSEILSSGPGPVPRYGLGAVVDPSADRMLLSHGFSSQGRFDDTWALDLDRHAWQEMIRQGSALPQRRCLHGMAFDASRNRMYLYGGCSSGVGPCPRGDLWAYDLGTRRWQELSPTGDRPTDRSNVRIAYDTTEDRLILFAGVDVRGTQDTWTFEAESASWVRLDPTGDLPPVRWSQAMVYDETERRLLVYAGTDGAVWHDDFWELRF